VLPATPVEARASARLVVAADRVAAAVTAAAAAALADPVSGPFSPARLRIGQRLYRSAIDAALMVPGVVAVHDLTVSWAGGVLGEFADPGQGRYFDLPAANIAIGGADAGG
jgi:phage-related baseplate assembly protein